MIAVAAWTAALLPPLLVRLFLLKRPLPGFKAFLAALALGWISGLLFNDFAAGYIAFVPAYVVLSSKREERYSGSFFKPGFFPGILRLSAFLFLLALASTLYIATQSLMATETENKNPNPNSIR